MNTKRTLIILAIASSLGMSRAWSAAPEDSDESGIGKDHHSKIEDNSSDEGHHGWHGPRDEHGHGPMHGRMGAMSDQRQHMMKEHQRVLSKLKHAQADLDKKVAQMNSSIGEEKIEAMSAVINEMANQRKQLLAHMEHMQERMMTHRDHMRQMPGHPEHDPAGAPPPRPDEEK